MVESIPTAGAPESVDGRVEMVVVVGGNAWLERLLLRLGPDVRVIDPPEPGTWPPMRPPGFCSAIGTRGIIKIHSID